jgi:hypothetical protein
LHANVDLDAEQMPDLSIDGRFRRESRMHPAIVGIARYHLQCAPPESPSWVARRRRGLVPAVSPRHISGWVRQVTLSSGIHEVVAFCWPCGLSAGDVIENRLSILDGNAVASYYLTPIYLVKPVFLPVP